MCGFKINENNTNLQQFLIYCKGKKGDPGDKQRREEVTGRSAQCSDKCDES